MRDHILMTRLSDDFFASMWQASASFQRASESFQSASQAFARAASFSMWKLHKNSAVVIKNVTV